MAAPRNGSVAVTGARSVLGRKIVERLAAANHRLVVIDIERPSAKARYVPLNLVEPNSDLELERVLRAEHCQTVIHLAYLSRPTFDAPYSHELQSIGTLNILHASRAAGVKRIISVSPGAVYGASGQNPNYLSEDHPVRAAREYEYMQDRAEADQHIAGFMKKHSDMSVTLLRMAPMIGPSCNTLFTRMLEGDATLTLLGFDPLLQFLHEDDAAEALHCAFAAKRAGIYNIAPEGVLPLSTALYRAEVVAVPVAHPVAYSLYHALWIMKLNAIPAAHLDYLRYPCLLDGAKAKRELGVKPRFTTQGALLEHLQKRGAAAA